VKFLTLMAIAVAALFLSAPAQAADTWVSKPGGTAEDFPCSFPAFRVCYYDVTTVSTTPIMQSSVCENITVKFNANIASAAYDNRAKVFDSQARTINANDYTALLVQNVTLDGNVASFAEIYGFDAPMFYVRFTTMAAGTARIQAHCHYR